MKSFLKFFVITVISLLIITISVLATVPLWLPADKLKDMLVEQLSKQTGRDVAIAGLKFNILKGIELNGVSIKETEKYKKRDFIRDDQVLLRYNLLALFTGNLVIYKFELVSPYCEIVKEPGGSFNFSDILQLQSQQKTKSGKTAVTEPAANTKIKGIEPTTAEKSHGRISFIKNIVITSIAVQKGRFVYVDYSKPQVMSVKIEDFNFNIEDIVLSAVKPISVNMDCTAYYNEYKIPVSLKAKVKADIARQSADIIIDPFIISGITTKGNIALVNLSEIKGNMESEASLKKMLELLPPELSKQMKDLNADMDITNSVNFSMSGNRVKFNDLLSLDKGNVTYKDKKAVEALKGSIRVDSDYSMSGNITMLLTGNDVRIKLKGTDIASTESGKINIDIYSPKFAVEYLMAMFPQKSAAIANTKASPEKVTTKKTKKLKRQEIKSPGVIITLKADSIFYKDVTAGKTSSSIKFSKGKLTADTLINAYNGSINFRMTADVNSENYSMEASISGVKLHDFIDNAIAVMPRKNAGDKNLLDDFKGKVSGDLQMEVKFSGDTFSRMDRTIAGKGGFSIKNGRIISVKMAQNLGQLLNISALNNDMPFDLIACDFNMASGTITTKNFRMYNGTDGRAGDIKVDGAGWVTVDNRLDFKLQMDFNPRVAGQIAAGVAGSASIHDASYAFDKDGWLPVDARVYNTVSEQKYDLAQPRIMENIKRNLSKKVTDQGKKFLEDKGKDLLKNLFK
jgi:uncharacterized protein involved in outer membrane biogenesis